MAELLNFVCNNPVALIADHSVKFGFLTFPLMGGRFTLLVEVNLDLFVGYPQAFEEGKQVQPFSYVCRCAVCAPLVLNQHSRYNAGSW